MKVKHKLSLSIYVVGLIVLANFLMTWYVINQKKDDAVVINLAGRQRMLSQKITKELFYYRSLSTSNKTDIESLERSRKLIKDTIQIFDQTLKALKDSGKAPLSFDLATTKYRQIPKAQDEAYAQLEKVSGLWSKFQKNILAALNHKEKASTSFAWVWSNNIPLLKELNKVVTILQIQLETKVQNLLWVQLLGTILAGLSIFIGIATVSYIMKYIQKATVQLQDSSSTVSTEINELNQSTVTLSEATRDIASSIQQTSASLEQIKRMVEQNSEYSKSSVLHAQEMRDSSDQGNKSIFSLKEAIQDIMKSNENIEKIINVMNEISNMTTSIDEIVFQTKLLSFNASVEAERAGEYGKGFAVVAQEVGNLAQQSGKSAQEISGIVTSGTKNVEAIVIDNKKIVENGHAMMNKSSAIFEAINDMIKEVNFNLQKISTSSSEQETGIRQICEAIIQFDQAMQKNSSATEKAVVSNKNIENQTKLLNDIIGDLNLLIDGKKRNIANTFPA